MAYPAQLELTDVVAARAETAVIETARNATHTTASAALSVPNALWDLISSDIGISSRTTRLSRTTVDEDSFEPSPWSRL
jgi:hypothetical protein